MERVVPGQDTIGLMMSNLLAARLQMAVSLGFHIVFAVVGIAMPLMMALAEWRWLRTGDQVYLTLAKRWAKGTAILFAVGAVSGTVLSFELGLLWPTFMAVSGPIIGILFSMEGSAFFVEAIFLGIYLYGWGRIPPRMHFLAGLVVATSGLASAVFVVSVNGWMNTPAGFLLVEGKPVDVDPLAVMFNPAALGEVPHMVLAAYIATGFAVAGIHAVMLLRDPRDRFHRTAFAIALLVGGIPAMLQPLSGDYLAKSTARHQPAKLAAFEGHFHTEQGAAFAIGGIPDTDAEELRYALEIPYGLSLILYWDPNATVTGLDAFPRDEWPPVGVVRTAFQVMVAIGVILPVIALWGGWRWWRYRNLTDSRRFLWTVALVSPLGLIGVEAGWVVTEVGRQPWIIDGLMRTAEAVTPMPGLIVPCITFTALYCGLAGIVIWLLRRHVQATRTLGRDFTGVKSGEDL